MLHRRWPAYSAVFFLAVGVACLIGLVIKAPAASGSSAVAAHPRLSATATVAQSSKTGPVRAARTS